MGTRTTLDRGRPRARAQSGTRRAPRVRVRRVERRAEQLTIERGRARTDAEVLRCGYEYLLGAIRSNPPVLWQAPVARLAEQLAAAADQLYATDPTRVTQARVQRARKAMQVAGDEPARLRCGYEHLRRAIKARPNPAGPRAADAAEALIAEADRIYHAAAHAATTKTARTHRARPRRKECA